MYSLGPVDKKIWWSTGSGGEQLTKAEMALRLRISPAAVTQRAAMIAAVRGGDGVTAKSMGCELRYADLKAHTGPLRRACGGAVDSVGKV